MYGYNTDLRYYKRKLANTNKALSNIIGAIEAGIYTETTKQRLEELEDKRRHLEENIAIEKARVKESLSEKEIVQHITSALKLKAKQAVEMLIKRVDVFKDLLRISLKYMDGKTTDTPPDKTTDNPDRNDSCRGFLILSYNEQYKVYHARTYKYKGFREYHSVKAVRIEIYIQSPYFSRKIPYFMLFLVFYWGCLLPPHACQVLFKILIAL